MRSKQDYKFADSPDIPKEWRIKTIDQVCYKPEYGYTQNATEKPIGPKFLRISDIQDGKVNWQKAPFCECPDNVVKKYLIQSGDIFVARTGATTGKSYLIKENPKAVFASYLIRIRAKHGIFPEFLIHFLNSNFYWKQVKQKMGGSAQGGLNASLLSKLLVLIPPLEEQQQIASILSTVDESMQKSDQIITKTQQLKTGLMQQLLTKGIGHMRFKQTEFAETPEEWEVVYLRQIVSSYRNGIYKPSSFYGRGIPSVRMYNIEDGKVNKAKAPLLDVTKQEATNYGLLPGDILINRVNSIDQVGKAGIVQDDLGNATFESKNIRVRVSPDRCNPNYLAYFLCTSMYLKQIRSTIKPAVAQATINQDDLDQIQICMPPLAEQQEIASILSTLDEKIETEMQRKEQVEHLKKGFMNDLLTGKVRVKVT